MYQVLSMGVFGMWDVVCSIWEYDVINTKTQVQNQDG